MGISEKVKNVGNLFRIQTIRPGKVTKFMDSLLKLLNALGLFKSPGRRQSPYSHLLQSFYMGFAQGQFAFCLVLIYSCTFVCSSKDFLEFFTLLMEVTCMTMILTEVLLLNTKRAQLLKLLERINKFDVASYPSPLMKYHWLEQFTWLFYGGFTFVTYLIKFVGVFIPITAEEVEHTRRIYGLKYPQNRLPVCMWIPYVDTSEPRYYVPLYLQELYMATLGFSMVMTSALLIPFIILHLVGQHLVLCRWLESLGKNCVGAGPGSRLQDAYDVYQMRRCIVLHRRLLDFRSQVKYLAFIEHSTPHLARHCADGGGNTHLNCKTFAIQLLPPVVCRFVKLSTFRI